MNYMLSTQIHMEDLYFKPHITLNACKLWLHVIHAKVMNSKPHTIINAC